MNQNYRHFLNLNSEERPQTSKPPRTSLDKYPISNSKVSLAGTAYFNKNPPNDNLKTTKNMRQILNQAGFYDEHKHFHEKQRNSSHSNKVETSGNFARNSKNDYEKSINSEFTKPYYEYTQKPKTIASGNGPRYSKYVPSNMKNENSFNPSIKNNNLNSIIAKNMKINERKNLPEGNPMDISNAFNNVSNTSIPSINTKLTTNKEPILVKSKNAPNSTMKNFANKIDIPNQHKYYSPANNSKKREMNGQNMDSNANEENYNVEPNEGSTKPNTTNINIIQNKLILTKRDSDNEIVNKTKINSQQNSPYLLTENSKRTKEIEVKPKEVITAENHKYEAVNNANNGRTVIDSFKEFSENFMKKTKKLFNFESNKNTRTKCQCDSSLLNDSGSCWRAINWIQHNYKLSELENLKRDYEKMQSVQPDEKCVSQIEKDLPRTFPSYPYFNKESEGNKCLSRVLVTFSSYEPQMGYVQGMNFIAGNLLFHAEEYLAFWLLVMLFEVFELRDIYMPKLPGLSKHCQILELLILTYMGDLYRKMAENSITVSMFFSPWIFSLFGVLIPIEHMGDFLDNLLKGKWPFVYKFVFFILRNLKTKLMQEDTVGMLTFLTENNYKNDKKQSEKLNWKVCIQESHKVTLENGFINKMLDNFDEDKQLFRCIK